MLRQEEENTVVSNCVGSCFLSINRRSQEVVDEVKREVEALPEVWGEEEDGDQ